MNRPEDGRETQSAQQMQGLEAAIESAFNSLSLLKDKLQPILRVEPKTAEAPSMAKEGLVPLASEIRGKAERVAALNELMIDIMDSLEL